MYEGTREKSLIWVRQQLLWRRGPDKKNYHDEGGKKTRVTRAQQQIECTNTWKKFTNYW